MIAAPLCERRGLFDECDRVLEVPCVRVKQTKVVHGGRRMRVNREHFAKRERALTMGHSLLALSVSRARSSEIHLGAREAQRITTFLEELRGAMESRACGFGETCVRERVAQPVVGVCGCPPVAAALVEGREMSKLFTSIDEPSELRVDVCEIFSERDELTLVADRKLHRERLLIQRGRMRGLATALEQGGQAADGSRGCRMIAELFMDRECFFKGRPRSLMKPRLHIESGEVALGHREPRPVAELERFAIASGGALTLTFRRIDEAQVVERRRRDGLVVNAARRFERMLERRARLGKVTRFCQQR